MAEVVRYVDPDATGAGDGTSWTNAYTSLGAWQIGEMTDLVTADDWHHVYCRSSSGTADTTEASIIGWTTSATCYLLIEAAEGHEAVKTGIDTSRYRLSVTDPDTASLDIRADYIRVDGLQIELNYTSAAYKNAVRADGQSASNDIRIENCYINGPSDSESHSGGLQLNDTDIAGALISNTIVTGFHEAGINLRGGDADVYHCIVYGTTNDGFFINTGQTGDITNCAVFNNGDDFDDRGSMTIDHCASDDGDGTNNVSASGSDWDNEFNASATGDFTLLDSGNLYHGGTTISGGPSTDIDGDSWHASTPSIGPDEIPPTVYALPQYIYGDGVIA